MLAVAKFLTEQNLVAEAVAVFNTIDKQAKAFSAECGTDRRADEGRAFRPCQGGLDRIDDRDPTRRAGGRVLIWDGGLEVDAVEGLNQFNWAIRLNKFAWIAIDRSVARTGGRSLKVVFAGLDTTTLSDQVQQTMVLKPGGGYHLECYAKSIDMITPKGLGSPSSDERTDRANPAR